MPRKPTRKKTVARKASRKPTRRGGKPAPPRRPRRLWRWLFGSALLGLLLLGGYSLHLSQQVRVQFEGKRWAVPARVYGRPLELYAGARIERKQLVAELKRLGYQPVRKVSRPGTYAYAGGRYLIHTRSFDFWDGKSPSALVRVAYSGDELTGLSDANSGEELAIVRLEAPMIGSIYPSHNEDRILLRRADLPELLVKGLIAVEDRDFYRHHGVNPKSIARAMLANVRAGRVVQGGSTLTQQLVKNFFLTRERSLTRKLNEALMALILDARYAKDEILEAYANEIYLGQDGERAIHGFGLASHFYFDRPIGELRLEQIALLVGMVKGPSLYAPRKRPEKALARRNLVLRLMADQGLISEAQRRKASRAGLGISQRAVRRAGGYPAFMDLVRRQLRRDYRAEDLTSEGLRIFTTLDPWVQRRAEQGLASGIAQLEKQYKLPAGKLEGAAVIASPQGGEVLAVVGGRQARFSGFNRALDAVRPIGSLVKPAVYLTALMQPDRYHLMSPLQDKAITLEDQTGQRWSPKNFDKREHGQVQLLGALARSLNLATVRLGMDLGLDGVIDTLQSLGVKRPIKPYPSLLLGALSLSPLEVTQVYQTLAAGGFRAPLRAIREVLDARGEPLQRYPLTVEQAVPAGPVYLLNRGLQTVVASGTARALPRLMGDGLQLAGKTGTTDDLRDSWFAGFAGDKVAVVWLGRDDNQPAGLTGSAGALRVWAGMLKPLRPLPLSLTPPDEVELAWVDPANGLLANERCDGAQQIPFVRGHVPQLESSCVEKTRSLFDRLFR